MAVEMETYCNFSNVEKPINTSITIIELVQYKFKLKQIALYDVYGVWWERIAVYLLDESPSTYRITIHNMRIRCVRVCWYCT